MAALKPSKPKPFNGRRDALTVETWLFQTRQCLELVQIGNPQIQMNDQARIAFAGSLMKDVAENW